MVKDKSFYIYSLTPISIFEDDRLTFLERLILILIVSLCKQKDYCWATNKFFMDIFKVSKPTISKSISNLASCNYIEIKIDNKNINNSKRQIRLSQALKLEIQSIKDNNNAGVKENLKQYNKKENNKKINKIYYQDKEGNEYWQGKKIESKEATLEEQLEMQKLLETIYKED